MPSNLILTLTMPQKCVSKCTNSTTNKGVEAKEKEIANARLDINESSSVQLEGGNSSRPSTAMAAATATGGDAGSFSPVTDDSTSFIQVVVRKHRGPHSPLQAASARASPSPHPSAAPRLPSSSSPIHPHNVQQVRESGSNVYVMPQPLLLTYPLTTPAHFTWQNVPRTLVETATSARNTYQARGEYESTSSAEGAAIERERERGGAGDYTVTRQDTKQLLKNEGIKQPFWKKMINFSEENLKVLRNGPDRVEIYYLERCGGEYLTARDGSSVTVTERLAARATRFAVRALDELLAVPQLLVAIPVALLLQVERAVLKAFRDLCVGGVAAASDLVLKPALATLHNALLLPALQAARAAAAALREALAPLSAAAGDAADPLARLLAQVRLVHVTTQCHCHRDTLAV